MEKEAPFRLVRDNLGFYSQVPVEIPDVEVVHDRIIPVCEPVPAPRKMGRPPKKSLNAEFEVD
jgi:hypothetical protein